MKNFNQDMIIRSFPIVESIDLYYFLTEQISVTRRNVLFTQKWVIISIQATTRDIHKCQNGHLRIWNLHFTSSQIFLYLWEVYESCFFYTHRIIFETLLDVQYLILEGCSISLNIISWCNFVDCSFNRIPSNLLVPDCVVVVFGTNQCFH